MDGVDEEKRKVFFFKNCHLKRSLALQSAFFTFPPPLPVSLISISLYIFNLSHKAHYSYVPAAIAVTLS